MRCIDPSAFFGVCTGFVVLGATGLVLARMCWDRGSEIIRLREELLKRKGE